MASTIQHWDLNLCRQILFRTKEVMARDAPGCPDDLTLSGIHCVPANHKPSNQQRSDYYYANVDVRSPAAKYLYTPLTIFFGTILLITFKLYLNYRTVETTKNEPEIQQTQTPAQEPP